MDLCRIIFLFSDLITKEALILLHNDDHSLFEMEVPPQQLERTSQPHGGSCSRDPLLPPRPLLVALQMSLSLLEPPHLQQP
jgi:hypothetical protein